jgi:hypothetical protein
MKYFLFLFLFSCATIKKTESKKETTIIKDSIHVILFDSVTKTIDNWQYMTKTTTYFDTVWITKDSVISVPKYTTTWSNEVRYRESDSKVSKKDSLSDKGSSKVVVSDKSKVVTQNNFWKVLIGLIIVLCIVLYFKYER